MSLLKLLPVARPRVPRTQVAPPPPLPEPHMIHVGDECGLEYIDLRPMDKVDFHEQANLDEPTKRTLVLLHGAPGTFHDFRYLIPPMQRHAPGVRIIGINFPGFGNSTVDEKRFVELTSATRAAQITLHALRQLCAADERVFLVGHSFGGHAAINLAALNERTHVASEVRALDVRGLVLLASAGARPHRVLRPRENALLIQALQSSLPGVSAALPAIVKAFYTSMLGFPSGFPRNHYVAGVVRAGSTDFSAMERDVAHLRSLGVPSLSAWSSHDEFMEDAIPIALAAALGSSPRLVFEGAGHNLQKTRADELALEIAQWSERVLCASASDRATSSDAARLEIHP